MLQRLREKITGWVAIVILALLAFVFAVWGIDIGFSGNSWAAVVDGEKIPVETFRRAYQNEIARYQQAMQGEIPEVIEQTVRRNVVEGLVRQELLSQRADNRGYRVGDQELAEHLRGISIFQVGGQFNLDSYRAMLAASGVSQQAFERDQRRNLEIQQMQTGIIDSAFATPDEIARRAALQGQTREAAWLTVRVADLVAGVELTDEEVQAEYEQNPDRYRTEESVDIEYIELNLADVSETVAVDEEELRQYYEDEKARDDEFGGTRFTTPERRQARHILINIDDDTDEAAALERIEAIRARLDGGEDFGELAKAESEDKGSASLGGDLGWVERDMMVAPFEEALFALDAGAMSAPVKTRFGYHLIELLAIEESQTQSFEDARIDLESELKQRKGEDRYYELRESMANAAFENPDSLEAAASVADLPVQRLDGLRRSGGPGIASDPRIAEIAFSEDVLERGENGEPVEIEDGRAVVLRVVEHYESEVKPLDEVREQIDRQLRRDRAREIAEQRSNAAVADLTGGADMSTVAEQYGAIVEPSRVLTRNEATVPAPLRTAIFQAPRPEEGRAVVGDALLTDGSRAVFAVTRVVPGTLDDANAAERDRLASEIEATDGGSDLRAYLEEMRQNANVVIADNEP